MEESSLWMRLKERMSLGTTAPGLTLSQRGQSRPHGGETTEGQMMEAESPSAGPTGLHHWWEIKEPDEKNTCYSLPISTCFPLQPPNHHPLLTLLRSEFSPLPDRTGDAVMEIRRGPCTAPRLHGWTSGPIVHHSLAPTVRVALLVWH